MVELSKRTGAEAYFKRLLEIIKNVRIKAIFSLGSPSFNNHYGYRSYMEDENVYIMFEDENCLVIDYRYIDELELEFRKLTLEEKREYVTSVKEKGYIGDYFNNEVDIYDIHTNSIIRRESVSLEYGCISEIRVQAGKGTYEKWVDSGIVCVEATDETFNEITLVMDNSKKIAFYAGDAQTDGYGFIYSEDAKVLVEHYCECGEAKMLNT